MGEIRFKATRRLHNSGYRVMEKSGDMQFDLDNNSSDVVWLTIDKPGTVRIDCERDGTYRVFFEDRIAYIHNPELVATSGATEESPNNRDTKERII